jgi:hypothetical protein
MKSNIATRAGRFGNIRLALVMAAAFASAGLRVAAAADMASLVCSPSHQLCVNLVLDGAGVPRYSVQLTGREVLQPSRLGLVRDDADFSAGLKFARESAVEPISDDYTLLTSKRLQNHYRANRRTVELRGANGETLQVIFQVSDDGVAFRYRFPAQSSQLHRIREERSSFAFQPRTLGWLQPIAVAKSGWKEVAPSYEEVYEMETPMGTPSPTGAGWVYPALFHTPDASDVQAAAQSGDARSGVWLLVSESSLPRNYSGTHLQSHWRSTEYTVAMPDPLERIGNGPSNPESTLPWTTPWRFVVIGSLKTVVESTLGTDLADPPAPGAVARADAPGKASWSWPLLGDDQITFDVQKRFIDYAADMHWRYTLVDSLWDKQIGYDRMKQLVDYAAGKNVRILAWYNSAGDWNISPQTPRDKLLTHASRVAEFDRLKAMGVAGLKVDFFGGDGQSVIAYYHDILDDAAPYGFVMNFHGATLPRGWQRTYPNLMTMEAVRGLEFVTFLQKNAEDEPSHAAMLPFARNVFDPMDFTPVVLDRINGIERRTTSAFELALSVLFTSGIQHYAEIPEGMARAPDYVRQFLREVPSVWEDVRFIDGFPGKYAVIARKAAGRWYVAGVNGEAKTATLHLSFADLDSKGTGTMITDGDGGNLSFGRSAVTLGADRSLDVVLKPHGGFVITLE